MRIQTMRARRAGRNKDVTRRLRVTSRDYGDRMTIFRFLPNDRVGSKNDSGKQIIRIEDNASNTQLADLRDVQNLVAR